MPTPWSAPYDVASTSAARPGPARCSTIAYRGSTRRPASSPNTCCRATTNVRRVWIDNSTTPVTFWVGSNHGASIVKLEPLD